jgi:hypothetical protein
VLLISATRMVWIVSGKAARKGGHEAWSGSSSE